MGERISVLIIDPNTLFRQGLALLLRRRRWITVFGEASSTSEASELVKSSWPDMILADVPALARTGRGQSLAFLESLKSSSPANCHLLVISASSEEKDVIGAFQLGAVGYLPKTCDADEVCCALRLAVAGQIFFLPRVAADVVLDTLEARVANEMEERFITRLSQREIQVLEILALGASNKQIARELFVSESTVKAHTRNILEKLKLGSKGELVAWGARHVASIGGGGTPTLAPDDSSTERGG